MKQKFFDLCRRVWTELVSSFDEYNKMKRQQLVEIVKADEAGNYDEVVVISEKL